MGYTDIEYKFKKIGKNVQISPQVYIRYPELVEIGDNVIIDEFVYITTALKLGNFIHIAPHVSIIGGRKSKLIMEDFTDKELFENMPQIIKICRGCYSSDIEFKKESELFADKIAGITDKMVKKNGSFRVNALILTCFCTIKSACRQVMAETE